MEENLDLRLSQAGVELVVKPATKPCRDLKLCSVGDELHDVPGAIQHGGAVLAHLKVRLHAGAQLGIDGVVDVIRDLAPNFAAANFDHNSMDAVIAKLLHTAQDQGRTFLNSFRPVVHDPSIPGASASRICRRARKRRVFTLASLMPRILAVSAMLTC